jgi:hypothetical protein
MPGWRKGLFCTFERLALALGLLSSGPKLTALHWHNRFMKNDFKGNKQSLPSKLCTVCGRTMTWRKAWARNWADVRYCSDACRTKKKPDAAPHG